MIQINLSTKKQKYLKKVLKVTDVQPIIQKVIDDWFKHFIQTKYKSKKTIDEMVNELDK